MAIFFLSFDFLQLFRFYESVNKQSSDLSILPIIFSFLFWLDKYWWNQNKKKTVSESLKLLSRNITSWLECDVFSEQLLTCRDNLFWFWFYYHLKRCSLQRLHEAEFEEKKYLLHQKMLWKNIAKLKMKKFATLSFNRRHGINFTFCYCQDS